METGKPKAVLNQADDVDYREIIHFLVTQGPPPPENVCRVLARRAWGGDRREEVRRAS